MRLGSSILAPNIGVLLEVGVFDPPVDSGLVDVELKGGTGHVGSQCIEDDTSTVLVGETVLRMVGERDTHSSNSSGTELRL